MIYLDILNPTERMPSIHQIPKTEAVFGVCREVNCWRHDSKP